MNWRLKGTIQKFLGALPRGYEIHYRLQRRFGGLRNFDADFSAKVDDWTCMAVRLADVGMPVQGMRFVEMGTGWYPTFPFCLCLGGAASVDTIDLNRHLRPELTLRAAMLLEQKVALIAEIAKRLPGDALATQQALVRALRDGASVKEASGGVIRYHAPGDASATGMADGSVDVVFSNSVLEHVPGEVFVRCLQEARRILRPGGVIFHSVNCGDHYAYVDSGINQLNYLRYSDAEWQFWNNRFLYQNRLRAIDFTDMARAAGFRIELDTSRPNPLRVAQLAETPVHPCFSRYPEAQLAITSIDFIGRRP